MPKGTVLQPIDIIKDFQKSSIDQINLDRKNCRSVTHSQSGTEAESSKDYTGRVVFEFFQNAVDRADSNIWMELIKDEFIISNDGEPFSIYIDKVYGKESDFYGLNSIHNGTKTAGESIGNKGVGFKSCWNVSENVIIESIKDNEPWGFELFNPPKVEHFDNEDIKTAIQNTGGKVPSFYFPKYFESKITNLKDSAVTKITIKLKNENAYEEIKKELEEFSKAKFFFLNQLKNKEKKNYEIHILLNNEKKLISSKDDSWQQISLKETQKEWHNELIDARKKENYENIPQEPNIAISFPPENDIEFDSNFYTYLPTLATCGFNILIHADFALDNARKHIPKNEYNNKILEIAAKLFVNELLTNKDLHNRKDFAKFLLPINENDDFAIKVWNELIHDNKLTEILKKVYTKERNFPIESYASIFDVISKWTKERAYGAWKDGYYSEIYDETIKYFCNEEIFLVYIDTENKTFLPPKKVEKTYDYHLFFKDDDSEIATLNIGLLKDVQNLKVTNFKPLGDDKYIKNSIVRKFSTLEIIRSLKDVNPSIEIIKFIAQLLDTTKEELSVDIKKRLLDIKLPTGNGEYKEVKYCYIDIDEKISSLFSDEFVKVDQKQLKEIADLEDFLIKIGVSNNRLPFVKDKPIILPFKEDYQFLQSNDLKDFMLNSLMYLDEEVIYELKKLPWFYDERKEKLNNPNEMFLFKSHDNRLINCIAQEKKEDKYKELYLKFDIDEIDDTQNSEKLINQIKKMKNQVIDIFHQDIYKKLTYQLSKIIKDEDKLELPILVTDIVTGEVIYSEDKQHIVFLETKHKLYKEQLKESYKFTVYFDTNTSHKFIQNLGIKVFNPDYTIKYIDCNGNDVSSEMDNELKEKLQKEFLSPFFALANEILGSSFEKYDAIKRWENLTINKAHNVILTIQDHNKSITVGSTESVDIDVLYTPIKDKQNKPTLIGEVAHDLKKPMENSNLRKFAQVFAEGIFRNQKLKSDFELYITGYLNKDENLKKEILINKGVEDEHVEEMENFIKENLLKDDEKIQILKIIKSFNINIDDYAKLKNFENYKNLDLSFDGFQEKFAPQFQSIIVTLIYEYKVYKKECILKEIDKLNKDKYLEVLCFTKYKNRDEYQKKLEKIKNEQYHSFLIEDDIFKLFDVEEMDKDSNGYIESLLDYENFTDEVKDVEINLNIKSNNLEAKSNPFTGNAKRSKINTQKEEEINEKIGLGQELKLSFKYAQKITDKRAFIDLIKVKIYANDSELDKNENLKKYIENLDKYIESNNLDFAKNVIQIASNNLDGLGYDLIIPTFDSDNQLNGIKKIELKTTTRSENIEIHFSHNEIQRILHYIEVDNWEIWLNNETHNITQIVREAVKTLPKELPFSFNDYILKLG